MDPFLATNQALWDKNTPIHLNTAMYAMESFRSGRCSLINIEREALGDVRGKSLLHLQCHFGQDSLSWARLGAKVTGADFSAEAIKTARRLSEELALDATFVQSNIYELPEHLNGQFDIVFTSYGVLAWLPDLEAWARVVRHFLKPGGVFYIVEFHPALMIFEFDDGSVSYPYFNTGQPLKETVSGTYADRNADLVHDAYFWMHSLSEITGALLRAGLTLEAFEEFDYSPWNCYANMKERAPGEYVFGDFGVALPHIFSLKMRG
jgi:ubiquinone/menaquinone biosynthesis C-methylase UbiE